MALVTWDHRTKICPDNPGSRLLQRGYRARVHNRSNGLPESERPSYSGTNTELKRVGHATGMNFMGPII